MQVAYLTLKLQNNHFQHSKSSFTHFFTFSYSPHFHKYIHTNNSNKAIPRTNTLLFFDYLIIIGRLLTTHISYTDFSKDSTGVSIFNLLRFFILYSNSILHHLYIPSILLLRNTLSQHLPLYSLTTLFNSIC